MRGGFSLDDLDPDQRVAAAAPLGPVCILAGAGTGKTRTITYRIAHMVDQGWVNPNRVLAVTFTARAAGEMRDRLHHMQVQAVQARTFHAAALRQLKYFWPQIGGSLPWRLLDNKYALVKRAVGLSGVETSKENVRDILGEIDWAKSSLILPEQYAAAATKQMRNTPVDVERVAQVYRRYEDSKNTDQGMLFDFDDLLYHLAAGLENVPSVSEEFRTQYRTFIVDEYQDVTPLQQRLLGAWLGGRDDLTVVGDANQTIYSFTGATPSYLLDFSRTYPHGVVTRLQRDYRSTPQVTDLANTVIARATGRAAGTRLTLQGMRPAGPPPSFKAYDDEAAEARDIAARVAQLIHKGVPPQEIAILYRINAQSMQFEQALREAGVNFQVRGGEEFFRRAEVRQFINQLTLIYQNQASQNPATADQDGAPGLRIEGEELIALCNSVLQQMGMHEREPDGAVAKERWHILRALSHLVEDIVRTTEGADMRWLLVDLRKREEAKQPPQVAGVTLASLHAAKGLEWDAVFLTGLTEGNMPITYAINAGDEAIEEERRLFYVGITRAREHLHLSWALARSEGGRKTRKRTRFLDGIVIDPESKSSPASRTLKLCRVCGAPLNSPAAKVLGRCETCASSADREVVDALRTWRTDWAKELQAPAYVVCSDATLMAIAEAMPHSIAELLKIPGIGEAKAERFGSSLLALLSNFE